MTRRALGRPLRALLAVGATVAIVASVAVTVATTTDHDRVRDEQAAAERAVAGATAGRRRAGAELDRLARSLTDAEARIERDRRDTEVLERSVEILGRMRARIEAVEADLVRVTTLRDRRQEPIDVLAGCRATLDRAASSLVEDLSATAASLHLEAGRGRCQQALALVRGGAGPVHPYDFPDPSILTVGSTSYAYGTNGPAGQVQVLATEDLTSWRVLPPALTVVPGWARPGSTWAPSVAAVGDGFVLHYTVRVRATGRQCISSATSASPTGPFVDTSSGPLVCQALLGGSIDPSAHRDEHGGLHLVWKSEGETVGSSSGLWTQLLGPDGRTLLGAPTQLLSADQVWEGGIIENPSMARLDGSWVLLYSANRWNTDRYAMAYAVCAGPAGPCLKPTDAVVRRSDLGLQGPGGGTFFRTADGVARVAYAAWDPGQIGFPNSRRLHLASVAFDAREGLRLG